ncbi:MULTISPECIES: DUF5784 family protein [Salinibaculum]|uniref:DUF5784 family protein n=1 Tax=Salinibaculum TaxID=2732368 RepID=UPI0030D423A4
MAGPLRFRRSTERWSAERVDTQLRQPLDRRFGARLEATRYDPPPGYEARRLTMGNGDLALFAWGEDAYWLGNTETPEVLWRTDKWTFEEAPYPMTRWAQRELLAELAESDPWLAEYDYVAWFFLPVLFSKDGRDTTRAFFRDHAGGFPDATRDEGLAFYEDVLSTADLDGHRYTMASKLGTSERMDLVRMRATMAEFNTAKLLTDAGYDYEPEVAMDSGHALDFRVETPDVLVEVTRPEPPTRRRAGTPAAALRETVDGKRNDQLDAHADAIVFVDCSSFRDDEWDSVAAEQPDAGHEPAVVYRMRPDGTVDGYTRGDVPHPLTRLV